MPDLKKEIDDAAARSDQSALNKTDEATPAMNKEELAKKKASDWWEKFAKAVEDPNISTYDYLKYSLLSGLGLQDANNFKQFINQAQKQAIKELIQLTDLKELNKTIKSLEKNRLFFDYRTRVGIQCARILLETYISAREEYETDMAKKKAQGKKIPSKDEQEEEIKKIVEQKLGEEEIAASIEEVAKTLTGKDDKEIKQTLDKAAEQLRDKNSLSKIANDVMGISKKYFTLDNAVNVGVVALPLLTWQYRWAVALIFGAYTSRKAAFHGYKATKAWFQNDSDDAKEHGHNALNAMKAAGGNVLAIGISPVVGKLPARLAIWSTFAASFLYNKSIEIGQNVLKKKNEVMESETAHSTKKGAIKFLHGLKNFFVKNANALVSMTAKAINHEAPNSQISTKFKSATKRVEAKKAGRVINGVWLVSKAAGRRMGSSLKSAFRIAAQTGSIVVPKAKDYILSDNDRNQAGINERFNQHVSANENHKISENNLDLNSEEQTTAQLKRPEFNGPS